jgi:hypothetical protein
MEENKIKKTKLEYGDIISSQHNNRQRKAEKIEHNQLTLRTTVKIFKEL